MGEVKIFNIMSFCNGTEYELFMEKNCCRCKKYVSWDEEESGQEPCPIEEKIGEAMWDSNAFPSEYIKQKWDDGPYVPHCTEFEEP